MDNTDNVALATELTIAWLGSPNCRATTADVSAFVTTMHGTLSALGAPAIAAAEPEEEHRPVVSVRQSLAKLPDAIVSMIDGKPYKSLKRHLRTHGLTEETYRERYGLKPDYPMVAPAYSAARREMALKTGLGRRPGQKVEGGKVNG